MTYWRHLKTALRQAWLTYTYNELVESEEFGWNEEDAKRTAQFFENTETGRKLKQRLVNYSLRSASFATKQSDVRHSGIANGIELAIQAIEQHFYVAPLRSEENPMLAKEEESDPRRLSQLL